MYQTYIYPFTRVEDGPAVILIDHHGKNADKGTIGSARKGGATDVRYVAKNLVPLQREDPDATPPTVRRGTVTLTVNRDRFAGLKFAALTYRLTDTGWNVGPASKAENNASAASNPSRGGTSWRPTVYMERISRYIEQHSGPVSMRELYAAVGANGQRAKSAVDIGLQVLEDEANINRGAQQPGKARTITIRRAYREADDTTTVPTGDDRDE